VSGRSHDHQRAVLMSASEQLRGRLRAESRGRRHLILPWKVDHVAVSDPFTAPSSTSTEKLQGLVDGLLVAHIDSERVITAQAMRLEEHVSRRPHPTVQFAGQPWLPSVAVPLLDSYGRCCVKGESTPWTHFWPVQNASNPS
jgi:hypothetical protein